MSSAFHQKTLSSCYWSTKVHKPKEISPTCTAQVEIYQENQCTKQETSHHTEHAGAAKKKKEECRRQSLKAVGEWHYKCDSPVIKYKHVHIGE